MTTTWARLKHWLITNLLITAVAGFLLVYSLRSYGLATASKKSPQPASQFNKIAEAVGLNNAPKWHG